MIPKSTKCILEIYKGETSIIKFKWNTGLNIVYNSGQMAGVLMAGSH